MATYVFALDQGTTSSRTNRFDPITRSFTTHE